MKKQNSRKKSLKYLLVLLLLISVGYAAIATTLKINGTATVKSSKWDVYWEPNSVSVTSGSVTTTAEDAAQVTNTTTKDEVAYNIALNEPGDFYEFTVDAVNNGSIDAMIAEGGVTNKVYSDAECTHEITLPDYLRYTVTYADTGAPAIAQYQTLAKKSGSTPTTKKFKVRVEYRTDIDKDTLNKSTDQTLYFRFNANYVQADSNAITD